MDLPIELLICLAHFLRGKDLGSFSLISRKFLEASNRSITSLSPKSDPGFVAKLVRFPNLASLKIADSREVTDDDMKAIGGLKLKHLEMYNCLEMITVKGFAYIGALTELETLILVAGCYENLICILNIEPLSIRACTKLKKFTLESFVANDKFLEQIGKMNHLRHLELAFCTGVTDAGLAHLAELTELETLSLRQYNDEYEDEDNLEITDAGFAHIGKLANLTTLRMEGCATVTDAGIAHLAALTNLTSLDLSDTGITDAGLAHLAPLTNLTRLDLSDTGITDAALLGHPADLA